MIPTRNFHKKIPTSPFQGEVRVLLMFLLIVACSAEQPPEPTFHPVENPEQLSAWGMLDVRDDELVLSQGVAPYDLATPLFSDYALKLRTVWTPGGAPARYNPDKAFEFPVGTVVTKTFYYPMAMDEWTGAVTYGPDRTAEDGHLALDGYRLIETRILTRRKDGWAALAYVWNDKQTQATLKRAGAIVPLTLHRPDGRTEDFAYLVPDANQCAACHASDATTKEITLLGLKARHLNKRSTFAPETNQLNHWIASGRLAGDFGDNAPANAVWTDETAPLAARARAYLDANCSHCHNPQGPADTSGLNLEPDAAGPALGVCKPPIAAGSGTGGRRYGIVPGAPEESITVFRMETVDPGAMMPELGRAVTHEEGVALIAEWIAGMEGRCG